MPPQPTTPTSTASTGVTTLTNGSTSFLDAHTWQARPTHAHGQLAQEPATSCPVLLHTATQKGHISEPHLVPSKHSVATNACTHLRTVVPSRTLLVGSDPAYHETPPEVSNTQDNNTVTMMDHTCVARAVVARLAVHVHWLPALANASIPWGTDL